MNERSIAEIIGMQVRNTHRYPQTDERGDILAWKCVECGEWIDDGDPRTTQCPSTWNQQPKPTVDDLLAWLSGRGYGWSAQKWYMGAKVTVVYIETGVEWSYSTPAHPTLLEALQNAVQAIDAQEQT